MGWVPGGELRLGGGYVSMRRRSWTRRLDFTPLVKISSIKTGTGGRHLPSHENHTYIYIWIKYMAYIYTIQGMMGPGYFGWPPPHHRCHWPTLAETTFVPKRNRQKSRKSMETGVFLRGLFWEISLPKFGVRGRCEHRGTIFVKIGSNSPCC